MERALITGAAGFIGSHLAAELLRRGWSVTGRDARSPASDPVAAENLGELTGDPRFQFVAGDVTGGDLAMVCEGVRVVFHLAGLPGVQRSWGDRFVSQHLSHHSHYRNTATAAENCRSKQRRIQENLGGPCVPSIGHGRLYRRHHQRSRARNHIRSQRLVDAA
jgi:nucleoside-diphosphate-sugar epimerase